MPPQEGSPAAGTANKPVLAIDIDEVLGQFVRQLCLFHNANHGTSLTPENFDSYFFHEVWGGSRESADSKMDLFFQSAFFLDGIPTVEGAERVLRKHAANFELHVVTSRQDILEKHTRQWVDAHYPGLFAELHFGNHFSKDGVHRSKPDLCRAIEAVLIVDDNMRYATQCAAAGIPAYLFGDYAWNRTAEPLPENVKRTVGWAEVEAELDALLDGTGRGSSGISSGGSGDTTSGTSNGTTNGGGSSSGGGCEANGHTRAPAAAAAAAAATATTAAVAVVVDGASVASSAAVASAAATQKDDVGAAAAAPSNVVGEDAVTCAA